MLRLPPPGWPTLIVLTGALVAVAVLDLRYRRIPNALCGAIALAGLLSAFLTGGPRALIGSLAGGLAGIALLFLQFRIGMMGGGDVKLLGAIGTFTGPLGALYILLAGSILGGVLAVAMLAIAGPTERKEVRNNLSQAVLLGELSSSKTARLPNRRRVPFGVALAAAAIGLLYFWQGG